MQTVMSPAPEGGLLGSGMYIESRCGLATSIEAPQSALGNCRLRRPSSNSPAGPQPPWELLETIVLASLIWTGGWLAALAIATPALESTVLLMKSESSPENAPPFGALLRTNRLLARTECNGCALLSATAPPCCFALLSAKTVCEARSWASEAAIAPPLPSAVLREKLVRRNLTIVLDKSVDFSMSTAPPRLPLRFPLNIEKSTNIAMSPFSGGASHNAPPPAGALLLKNRSARSSICRAPAKKRIAPPTLAAELLANRLFEMVVAPQLIWSAASKLFRNSLPSIESWHAPGKNEADPLPTN